MSVLPRDSERMNVNQRRWARDRRQAGADRFRFPMPFAMFEYRRIILKRLGRLRDPECVSEALFGEIPPLAETLDCGEADPGTAHVFVTIP